MSAYDTPCKNMQRACVLELYYACTPRKPIVYLDDECAGATLFFIERGLPTKHLRPVNFSSRDAAAVRARSGVSCVTSSIDDYVLQLRDDTCSVVWLDYMSRTLRVDVLRACLRVAPYVSITLSSRGVDHGTLLCDVRSVSKKCGVLLERPTFYKGKSDVANMVKFIVSRRKVSREERTEAEEETSPEAVEKEWHPVGERVYVQWGGRSGRKLTGAIVFTDDTRCCVRLDHNGELRWIPSARVHRDTKVPTDRQLNRVVGSTIQIPRRLWSKGTKGYDDVKRVRDHFVFRVAKRYAHKNRFAVSAISKTHDRPMGRLENFTLSYEQIACYAVPRGMA